MIVQFFGPTKSNICPGSSVIYRVGLQSSVANIGGGRGLGKSWAGIVEGKDLQVREDISWEGGSFC